MTKSYKSLDLNSASLTRNFIKEITSMKKTLFRFLLAYLFWFSVAVMVMIAAELPVIYSHGLTFVLSGFLQEPFVYIFSFICACLSEEDFDIGSVKEVFGKISRGHRDHAICPVCKKRFSRQSPDIMCPSCGIKFHDFNGPYDSKNSDS